MKTSRRTLIRAGAELLNAVNGVQPVARKGYISFPAFAFGWPTTELAPWVLSASALDAARRARRGAFRGGAGALAMLLTVASWVLLAFITRRGMRCGPGLEHALRGGLGPDYLAAKAPRPSGLLRTAISPRRFVEKAATWSYGPHGRANTLDIWRRKDLPRDAHAPVLVHVPGGAWVLGWRRGQGYPLLGHLAAQGWVCVSIDYRASPANTWPDQLDDVKQALAWVRDNIAEVGGDPDYIAITGGSAGGHLASLAALDSDVPLAAAVPVYGRYDWVDTEGPGRGQFIAFLERIVVKRKIADAPMVFADASPIKRVHADAPPFFVLHGRNDSIIPVSEAGEFVTALRAVSRAPVVYAELPGAQHGFDVLGSPRGRYSADAISRFLNWIHQRDNS